MTHSPSLPKMPHLKTVPVNKNCYRSCMYHVGRDGQEIPASATLEFTIHLFPEGQKQSTSREAEVKKADRESKAFSGHERLRRAEEAKARGNGFVKAGDHKAAMEAYRESLMLLESFDRSEQKRERRGREAWEAEENGKESPLEQLQLLRESGQLRVANLLNLSQCALRLEDPAAAAQHATEALDLESLESEAREAREAPKAASSSTSCCKALFRRAQARLAMGLLAEAREDLLKATQLEPQNREIREKLELCRERAQQASAWQKQAFGNLFGKAPEQAVTRRSREALESLPKVWMEIQIGSKLSKVEIRLYKDTVPRTAQNFLKLCTGDPSTPKLHYKSSPIHKARWALKPHFSYPGLQIHVIGLRRTQGGSIPRAPPLLMIGCEAWLETLKIFETPMRWCRDASSRLATSRRATARVASPSTDRALAPLHSVLLLISRIPRFFCRG